MILRLGRTWRAAAGGLLLAGPPSRAGAQVVAGVLRDASSGRPAAALYVSVRPQGERRFVGNGRADSAGRFVIPVPAAGVYQVQISLPDGSRPLADSVAATASAERPRELAVRLAEAEAQHMYFEFQVERTAAVLQSAPPGYPAEAAARGLGGKVLLQVAVDSAGAPVPETLVVLESPDPLLEDAARAALLQYRFTPARLHGRAVRQLVQIPFTFRPASRAGRAAT